MCVWLRIGRRLIYGVSKTIPTVGAHTHLHNICAHSAHEHHADVATQLNLCQSELGISRWPGVYAVYWFVRAADDDGPTVWPLQIMGDN